MYDLLLYAINETKEIALKLQKEQLNKGLDNEGEVIGTYSRATELAYLFDSDYNPRKPKKEGEPYNFEDTGGLFDGMQLLFNEKEAQFWSSDSKTPFLTVKYNDLFGLTEDNTEKYIRTEVYPVFMAQIRKTLEL